MAFKPAPTTATVAATGTTHGTGIMTNTSMNNIGVTQQNSPFTHQPNWIASPLTGSGNDGTDVFTTG